MRLNEWISANTDKLGSEYELLFAKEVLPHLNGLDLDRLYAQYPFRDNDGRQRYCDFAIVESDDVRVAIEIDGYDKRGSGTGMSHADFIDWQRRQASLAAHGWHVLRFANKDVRDFPGRCADFINALLERLRNKESGRVQIVSFDNALKMVPNEEVRVDYTLSNSEIRGVMSKTKKVLAGVMLLLVLGFGAAILVPALYGFESESVPLNVEETSSIPSNTLKATGVAANQVGGVWGWGELICKDDISWRDISKRVGDVVMVSGPLLAGRHMVGINGSPTWIDVGRKFPDKNRLQLVIWGENRERFSLPFMNFKAYEYVEHQWDPVEVCVRGKVTLYKGVAQIELKDMSQIRINLY